MEERKTFYLRKKKPIKIDTSLSNCKSYKNYHFSNFGKTSPNFFLTQFHTKRNKKIHYNLKKKFKIPKETLIYDGYALTKKKFSYDKLIRKITEKENKECIEKNKLFKKPYPLIKFLSNRKMYNNTSNLLIELLNNDFSKLSKAQLNIIKYKKNTSRFPFSKFQKKNDEFSKTNTLFSNNRYNTSRTIDYEFLPVKNIPYLSNKLKNIYY